MRNTGWYIPYWRKPKKKGRQEKASNEEIARSDEQLEAVRQRWVERYRRTARALRLLGLSVGSNRGDVQARYEALRAAGAVPLRDLEDAYRHLTRVLPPQERRKRRPQPAGDQDVGTEGDTAASTADDLAADDSPLDDGDDEGADEATPEGTDADGLHSHVDAGAAPAPDGAERPPERDGA